jgi:hypothetical protein
MSLPLTLSAYAPTLGDHLENLVLLGCGLLLFILALALCSFLLDKLSKAFGASADWLERKASRRRKRLEAQLMFPVVVAAPGLSVRRRGVANDGAQV